MIDIIRACRDPNLFGPWFRDPSTWTAWVVFLRALFGLRMGEAERELFTRCTGRTTPPSEPASEGWIVCGRRSGKSFVLALIAVYLATFRDWRPYLAPGEVATIVVAARDRAQARVIMRYATALLRQVPLLEPLLLEERCRTGVWELALANRVTIEVMAASHRSVRGYSVAAALLDEVAFWTGEHTATPDVEVIEAVRPALATLPGSMLLAASSPYSRRGALFEAYRTAWGKDGPVLVWQAPTLVMNPTVPERVIRAATERDPAIAASEWQAEFRSDLESYVDRDAVLACVSPGVRERRPILGVMYWAFCDPSGGRNDSMTLAIAHREGECAVLDVIRERRPPFDPLEGPVAEWSELLRRYGIMRVTGDRYGGEWPVAAFRRHGIIYEATDKAKSALYAELLPLIMSRRIDLVDNDKLVAQLVGLERSVGRGGRDTVDHGPAGHDDVANAVAGAVDGVQTRAHHVPLVW